MEHSSSRRERYFKLNTRLASISDDTLREIFSNRDSLAAVEQQRSRKHLLKLGGNKVFIKRLPLSGREFRQGFSSKNLFALPCAYSYSDDSYGFGAYRQLLTHIKATNWVLEGECKYFPILYHYRIMPSSPADKSSGSSDPRPALVQETKSNNLRFYLEERSLAEYEIVMFFEYFPQNLEQWMEKNQAKFSNMMIEIRQALMFLRQNGLLHFNVDLSNMLCDGKQFVLNDFGLALDKRFELGEEERQFLGRNSNFDYAYFIYSTASYLNLIYERLDQARQQFINQRYGIESTTAPAERFALLFENLKDIQRHNLMMLQKSYVAVLENCHEVIRYMHDFLCDVRNPRAKSVVFNDRKAGRLLDDCGFL